MNVGMDAIIEYFTHIPSSHRSAILVGGLVFFSLLESGIPLFSLNYKRIPHAWVNIFFTITTIVINFLLAFTLLYASDWAVANEFGLLQWLPAMPMWLFAIIGLLLLDLVGAYFIHWLEHRVRWMWRFHLVHHTDPNVDTTTANRHHPGESIFRFIFTSIGALICGAPMWLIMMYQSMSAALAQFNHANIQFPVTLDRVLSWVLVTPGMHRIHHHYVLPYTDSNFGNIFSVWDRLFGTYRYMDNKDIIYGIDTHMRPEEHSDITNLLKIPFQKYRPPVGEGSKFKADNA
jgi:sterol desaturase/sphingolipid hydroxylase (fatty acid hydroxylase superfamily)